MKPIGSTDPVASLASYLQQHNLLRNITAKAANAGHLECLQQCSANAALNSRLKLLSG